MNILVNIYNKGRIPWLNMEGPVFGLTLSPGIYGILIRDPRVNMKKTTREDAEAEYKKYQNEMLKEREEKEKIILHDDIKVEDSVPVINENVIIEPKKEEIIEDKQPITTEEDLVVAPVVFDENPDINEDTSLDDAIDSVIDERPNEPNFLDEVKPVEKPQIKKYTSKQLGIMTKAELKAILRERGYLEGPYAGKYHDTVQMLIDKVKKTQE